MSAGKTGRITIAAVGRMKKSPLRDVQEDYVKRLKRYSTISLSEVKDAVGRGVPDAVAMERVGDALLKATAKARRRILLTSDGRSLSSEKFARHLRRQIETYGQLAFLLGGPLGFSLEVTAAADETLSLSSMTLPHELARVIFLEQLYRAFTILRGEPYHK